MNLPLPVGISDFRKLIKYRNPISKEPYLYIDKTNFIEEIAQDGAQVVVITRPRRFGKTINLSMLQYFYSPEVDGKSTAGLFDGLKISKNVDAMAMQGSCPVLFISFKNIEANDFDEFLPDISNIIRNVYGEHDYLLTSENLPKRDKVFIDNILTSTGSIGADKIKSSLCKLATLLKKHFKEEPIILIDEYDKPIQTAYSNNYYQKVISIFRGIFISLLKDSDAVKKAILTGVIRISKESLFSSLNNVEIYSVLREEYSSHFGFTATEVKNLLQHHENTHLDKIRQWYNGYKFGNSVVYNPWSIIKFLKEQGKLKSYWVNTSSNNLAEELIKKSDPETKEKLTILMQSKEIEESIDEHVVFQDLERDESAVWSLLLASGYLMAEESNPNGRYYDCLLKIPNLEVLDFYTSTIKKWISKSGGLNWIKRFIKALETCNTEELQEKLQDIIDNTMSFHDTGRKVQESTFHGFMLGIVVALKDNYKIKSNRESGYGRYDVALFPNNTNNPGIIMEFKAENTEDNISEELANVAIKQLKEQKYNNELLEHGCNKIISLGIGFTKRHVRVLEAK